MGTPEILCVSKLPPFLMSDLQDHFQIHDHEHITDPGALVAPPPAPPPAQTETEGDAAAGEGTAEADLAPVASGAPND